MSEPTVCVWRRRPLPGDSRSFCDSCGSSQPMQSSEVFCTCLPKGGSGRACKLVSYGGRCLCDCHVITVPEPDQSVALRDAIGERDRALAELRSAADAVRETGLLDHVQLDPLRKGAAVSLAEIVRAAAAEIDRGRQHFMDEFKRGTKFLETILRHSSQIERLIDENDRLRSALAMIAQVRHVSGSAQGAFRSNLRVADAVLAGADVRSVDAVEAIVSGKWVKP